MSDPKNRPLSVPVVAEVVAAYLSGNRLPASELSGLIRKVHIALAGLDDDSANPLRPEPMVPIKQSVRANHLVCLYCGQKFKMLKRHVKTAHRLSLDEYRSKWGLPRTYPTTAANYSAQRLSMAKQIGLGKPR